MVDGLKWIGLKVAGLFSKAMLLLAIVASVLWIPISNYLIQMGCDQSGLCNSAFENFLWVWGMPVAACGVAFALWVIGLRAGEAADKIAH